MIPSPSLPFSGFSTAWKLFSPFFHSMEKVIHAMEKFFHAMENFAPIFPRHGKSFPRYGSSGFFLLAALLFAGTAAAFDASPFQVTAALDAYEGQPALRVSFAFPPDHNLYASFAVADADGAPLAPLHVPEPDAHKPGDPEPSYSAGFSAFYAPPADGPVVVSYQGCKGEFCFMPQDVTLAIQSAAPSQPVAADDAAPADAWLDLLSARGEPARLSGSHDVAAFAAFLDAPPAADAGPADASETSAWRQFIDDPAAFYLARGIWPSVFLILIGGFLLNLTPCVLPMIPINLAVIGAGGGNASRAARFGLGLVYGLGMAIVYGLLGLVVVVSGSVFGSINASPVFNGAIAILFLVLSLAMFDVFQIDFSRFRKSGGGMPGHLRLPAVMLMGGISALLAGACVAPVLIAVLALSGSLYAKGVGAALALPFLLGVGMALPWPLAAAGLAILPKPGAWMEKVKKAFGALILLLALFYAWNAVSALRAPAAAAIVEARADALGDSPQAAPLWREVDFGRDPPGTFEALVAEAAASGKPILFDFGAHWCKACKLMQATTLQDPLVLEKIAQTFPIHVLADQPNRPPARDLLRPLGIQGFPTYLLYPAP
jgi:thioredoxin:protein disulfide reductase